MVKTPFFLSTITCLVQKNNHVNRVTYLNGSSLDISDLAGDFYPDIIFHLGEFSRVESSYDYYDLIIDNNLIPFTAVLNYAREKNAKLVYIQVPVLSLLIIPMVIARARMPG